VLFAALCAAAPAAAQSGALEHATSWSYAGATGPENWGALASEWGACAPSTRSSPILVPADGPPETGIIGGRLPAVEGLLYNTGYQVRVDVQEGGTLTAAGRTMPIRQFHLHTPAEHVRVMGGDSVRAAAEIHVVAQDAVGIIVLESRVVAGEDGDAFWNELADRAPTLPGARIPLGPVDLAKVLGVADVSAERLRVYTGSLTTPGCGGPVVWLLRNQPVIMQADAIATFHNASGTNARPLQPLGDERRVTVYPGKP
jgi:carbonic anhydrase